MKTLLMVLGISFLFSAGPMHSAAEASGTLTQKEWKQLERLRRKSTNQYIKRIERDNRRSGIKPNPAPREQNSRGWVTPRSYHRPQRPQPMFRNVNKAFQSPRSWLLNCR